MKGDHACHEDKHFLTQEWECVRKCDSSLRAGGALCRRSVRAGGRHNSHHGNCNRSHGRCGSKCQSDAVQTGTEVKRTAETNNNGQFNFPALPPATYRVSVEAAGFKTYTEDVTLLADQVRNLAIRLELGQATQTVAVEASSVQVDTVTPVLSQVI